MNVRRLEGSLLNYWVARSAGLQLLADTPQEGAVHDPSSGFWHPHTFCPSTDWSHGGPIVSNEWYALEDVLMGWFGPVWTKTPSVVESPLKWFMRAFVASQFGDEVEDGFGSEAAKSALQEHPPARPGQAEARASRFPQWLTSRM